MITRKVLAGLKEFKTFWQNNGPYRYALTSKEFPPVLLEEEEWIFSNDIVALLKELMQYNQQKMKLIKAPFNLANKSVLRPEELSEWKITNFPEEWNGADCDIFVPQGHLTSKVVHTIDETKKTGDAKNVERSFFICLEQEIEKMGYLLFKPRQGAKRAAVQTYLKEWEVDESDAGLS
ncbi:MAG: hypothetical protein L3J69_16180 [Desulfobacula sp.]|nr:hypothetical protein [Desulfobacula sp.]